MRIAHIWSRTCHLGAKVHCVTQIGVDNFSSRSHWEYNVGHRRLSSPTASAESGCARIATYFAAWFSSDANAEANLARASRGKVGNIHTITNISVNAWARAAYRRKNPPPVLSEPYSYLQDAAPGIARRGSAARKSNR